MFIGSKMVGAARERSCANCLIAWSACCREVVIDFDTSVPYLSLSRIEIRLRSVFKLFIIVV